VSSLGLQQLTDEFGRGQTRADARTHDQAVVFVIEDARQGTVRIDLLDIVFRERHRGRLDDPGREQRLERFGNGQGDQTGAGPTGGTAHEQSRARVVERSGDDEKSPE
jgi:hypothetical protein